MTKQDIVSELQKGRKVGVVTREEFAEWYNGIAPETAARKLKAWGVTKFDKRYYFIPDIADAIMEHRD